MKALESSVKKKNKERALEKKKKEWERWSQVKTKKQRESTREKKKKDWERWSQVKKKKNREREH